MSNLISLPIPAPGSYGLNTEQDITSLQPQWAAMAHNCVIDNNGRLGARHGYSFSTDEYMTSLPSTAVASSTFDVENAWSYSSTYWTFTNPGFSTTGASGSGTLYQPIPVVAGEYYTVSVTIANYVAGSLDVQVGGEFFTSLDNPINSNGTTTVRGLAGNTGFLTLTASTSDNFTVTAISVVGVGGNNIVADAHFDDPTGTWTKGTGWTIPPGDGWAEKAAGVASDIEQEISLIPGRSYLVSLRIDFMSAGTLTPYLGGTTGTARSADGQYQEVIVAGTTDLDFKLQASNTFNGSVYWCAVCLEDDTDYFEQVFEYLDDDGNSKIIMSDTNGAFLYKNGAVNTSISPATLSGAGNYKFQNFNSYVVGWQSLESPVYWDGVASTMATITFTYPSSGTSTWGNTVLSAFGRLWTTDSTQTVVKYSDLLVYNSFTNDAGSAGDPAGSAGIIDLKKVWPNGMDYVQAIEEFNGRIIFFGKRSILIYAYPWDPTISMQLEDTIEGIGCIARDSVQHIGEDIIFLSDSGVRSLARTIQEKSAPIGDLTKNIRKSFLTQTNGETKSKIRSTFNRETGEYVLTVPTSGIDYVLNFKDRLPDGTPKITTWNLNPTGMYYTQDGILYLLVNKDTSQGLVTYTGYQDNGESYSYLWHSPWISGEVFDPQLRNRDLIPKSLKTYLYGGTATSVSFQWAFDLNPTTRNANVVLDTVEVSEYGIAEYNVSEYSTGAVYSIRRPTMSGHGKLMQLRVAATINGYHFALQRLDPFIKVGSLLK